MNQMKTVYRRLAFVLIPLAAAAAMNGAIFGSGWNRRDQDADSPLRSRVLPPGWAVGTIWAILFGLLGFAMALSFEARDHLTLGAYGALALVCLVYPLYTAGLRLAHGIIGNLATLLAAFLVGMLASARRPSTLPYLAPLLLWLAYVNLAQSVACALAV